MFYKISSLLMCFSLLKSWQCTEKDESSRVMDFKVHWNKTNSERKQRRHMNALILSDINIQTSRITENYESQQISILNEYPLQFSSMPSLNIDCNDLNKELCFARINGSRVEKSDQWISSEMIRSSIGLCRQLSDSDFIRSDLIRLNPELNNLTSHKYYSEKGKNLGFKWIHSNQFCLSIR